MGAKRFPWKGGFRKVPPKINADLGKIEGDIIAVAAAKNIPVADIAAGQYAHLGLRADAHGKVTASGPVQPPADAGKWSFRNARGWDRKRPDLPMVPKSYVFETPNFGDAATYGTHMHVLTRDVYQHQVFEPQGMEIETTILTDTTGDSVLVKFALTPLLSRGQPEFELMLTWALSVLQENTGASGVVRR